MLLLKGRDIVSRRWRRLFQSKAEFAVGHDWTYPDGGGGDCYWRGRMTADEVWDFAHDRYRAKGGTVVVMAVKPDHVEVVMTLNDENMADVAL